MPQHMADLYAKQFEVWEQVSRRSSLSALALAATTPRPSEGKGGEGKSSVAGSKRGSPAKTSTGSTAAARPGHAQPVLKDTNRAVSIVPHLSPTLAVCYVLIRRSLNQFAGGASSWSRPAQTGKDNGQPALRLSRYVMSETGQFMPALSLVRFFFLTILSAYRSESSGQVGPADQVPFPRSAARLILRRRRERGAPQSG